MAHRTDRITLAKRVAPNANLIVRMELRDHSHSTDALSVSAYMTGITNLIKCSAEAHGYGDRFPIHVSAFNSGSFEFVLDFVNQVNQMELPFWDAIGNIADIIGAIDTFLALKKFLKGENPTKKTKTSDGKFVFYNKEGEQMTVSGQVNTLAENPKASREASRMFAEALADENIKRIEHRSDVTGRGILFPRGDFEVLQKRTVNAVNTSEHLIPSIVFRVVDAGNLDKEFRSIQVSHNNSKRAKAMILDEEFRLDCMAGKINFGAKTYITCDAVMLLEYDEFSDEERIAGYKINKVHSHVNQAEGATDAT